ALLKEFPDKKREIEPSLAEARVNLAFVLTTTKRTPQADAALGQGMTAVDRLVRDYPKSPYYHFLAARGHQAAALRSQAAGKTDEAEKALSRSVELLQELHRNSPETMYAERMLLQSHLELSQLHRSQNKLTLAVKDLQNARDLLAADPHGGAGGPLRVNDLRVQAARLLVAQKQYAEAQKEVEDAIEAARKLEANDQRASQQLANLRVHLAIIRALQGDHAGALAEALAAASSAPRDPFLTYNLACVHALCVKALKDDPT